MDERNENSHKSMERYPGSCFLSTYVLGFRHTRSLVLTESLQGGGFHPHFMDDTVKAPRAEVKAKSKRYTRSRNLGLPDSKPTRPPGFHSQNAIA